MAYLIYKSDGTAVNVPDNAIDTSYYNASGGGGFGPGNVPQVGNGLGTQLIGRNAVDYGTAIAQNFLQLQENFSSSSVPSDTTSLQGQLWFNQTSITTGNLYVRMTTNTSGGIANWAQVVTGTSGTAPFANALSTARSISTTGDATWTVNFDGSANVSGITTLATVNATVGTFGTATAIPIITVNAKGQITGVTTAPVTTAIATGLSGGTTGSIPYQSAPNVTAFLTAGTTSQILIGGASAPSWGSTLPGLTLTGSGSFSGVTLNGTVTNSTDAVTKAYVDSIAQGVTWKTSVVAATTVAGTLASSFENGDVIDGITLVTGDRILIKNQASATEDGIYTVNVSGAPTRAVDADIFSELQDGTAVFVQSGTVNNNTGWTQTATLTSFVGQIWIQFSGAGTYTAGTGLSLTGTQFANTGVLSFNTRTGAVTLTSTDVTSALGFTPSEPVVYTTTGSGFPFILTPSPAVTVATDDVLYVHFHLSATGPTINVSGLGVRNIKQYDSLGVKIPAVISAAMVSVLLFDSVDYILQNPLPVAISQPWFSYFNHASQGANGVINYISTFSPNPGFIYASGVVTISSAANAGIYYVIGTAKIGQVGGGGGGSSILLYRNGIPTGIESGYGDSNNAVEFSTVSVASVLTLGVGDSVSIFFRIDSGPSQTLAPAGSFTGFRIA